MKAAKDQKDNSLYSSGMSGDGYSRCSSSSSVQVNQHTGHMNDGRLVNFKRGPTVGNHDQHTSQKKVPPTASVPSTKISNPDKINYGSQHRGSGMKEVKKPGSESKIDYGRGPTKGNE